MMNIKEKKIFVILMVIVGSLIFNFNSELAALSIQRMGMPLKSDISEIVSIFTDGTMFPIVSTNNLLTDVLSGRMTNIKGCLANSFVHAIYGHSQNKVVAKYGFKNNIYGFILGIDDVWVFANEKYLRLGAALGYTHGEAISVNTVSVGKSLRIKFEEGDMNYNHDAYTVKLFCAHESFNDKRLKTNIGIIFGYNYNRSNLVERMLPFEYTSHGLSLGVEFIKIYTPTTDISSDYGSKRTVVSSSEMQMEKDCKSLTLPSNRAIVFSLLSSALMWKKKPSNMPTEN
ncbi:MAG: autotransporter outer membrane beta-barrel domain-containing protein [Puniceicoccales bacterium]|jgi:hypothetical protein|nr:autotransporter outer membrane beta-barrel domain-containing protein [Puniceicoccales bacterium]